MAPATKQSGGVAQRKRKDAGAAEDAKAKRLRVEGDAEGSVDEVVNGGTENDGGDGMCRQAGRGSTRLMRSCEPDEAVVGTEDDEGADQVPSPSKKAPKTKKIPVKAKAKPAPKSKAKPKAAGDATAPKRRKVRTLADKQVENGPMNDPFFVETGGEWHGTNVDFDELGELRRMWELPAACHILWLLQAPLTLRVGHTLLEYEAALLNPEGSALLEDVFTKLLLKKSERECLAPGIGLKYEWWNKQLREYYMALYEKWYALLRKAGEKTPASFLLDSEEEEDEGETDEERDVELSDDEWLTLDILKSRLEVLGVECPLKHQSFSDLSVVLRCKILLNLCEAVMDDPSNTDYIRQMEEDDLRVEPLGCDRAGNLFYYFPQFYNERRIYRFESETTKWALWAKGDEAFKAMLSGMKRIKGRKGRGEQELIDHLEVIMEQIADEADERAKELEKATKKAILEAIPRKRSMRIQVKQLEQMEKQKEDQETKRALSMEELAELKRAEFLRKVEQDAEREEREKDREAKRLAREEAEREAAMAERELRRQRRLEKEKQEEELAAQQEEQRKKQEEARLLRAMQRQSTIMSDEGDTTSS